MKVCVLGSGLASLTLAKGLINHGIKVDLISNHIHNNYDKSQTLGISQSNIDFLQDAMIEAIYKLTNGVRIAKQSEDELLIIMRGIYLQYSKNLDTHIDKQVYELNKKVLKYAVKTEVKKLVNISSVSAYGILTESPIQETMEGKPFIHYGVTKKASEEYCKIFKGTYGLDTVNLRLFYAYGERYATFDHSALVNFLDRAKKGEDLIIYGDGKQVRSYTYVSDIVDGILSSVHGESNGEVYNISGGSTCNILELAETVLNVTKAKSNVVFSKPNEYRYSDDYVKIPLGVTKQLKDGTWIDERNYIADNTKALKDFGYNPKINLVDGINKTWEWMNK